MLCDSDLTFSSHCSSITARSYQILGLIFRALPADPTLLTLAFKLYVRPILEYASVLWSPRFSKDTHKVENVQRYFTRRALFYPSLSYPERLIILNLDFLETRRLHTDLVFCYRLLNNHVSIDSSHFLTLALHTNLRRSTRNSNDLTLSTPVYKREVRKHFWSHRTISIWNSLPRNVLDVEDIKSFKNFLLSCNLTRFALSFD